VAHGVNLDPIMTSLHKRSYSVSQVFQNE
jgi:hypothetical protein